MQLLILIIPIAANVRPNVFRHLLILMGVISVVVRHRLQAIVRLLLIVPTRPLVLYHLVLISVVMISFEVPGSCAIFIFSCLSSEFGELRPIQSIPNFQIILVLFLSVFEEG